MLTKSVPEDQLSFYSTFEEQLNHQHPLYMLARAVDWKKFDDSFKKHYSQTSGAPAKPIRLLVGLLILKHLRNLSDESVVQQWAENSYYQYFCGEEYFAAAEPCVPTELVEFRKRIGEEGVELISAIPWLEPIMARAVQVNVEVGAQSYSPFTSSPL